MGLPRFRTISVQLFRVVCHHFVHWIEYSSKQFFFPSLLVSPHFLSLSSFHLPYMTQFRTHWAFIISSFERIAEARIHKFDFSSSSSHHYDHTCNLSPCSKLCPFLCIVPASSSFFVSSFSRLLCCFVCDSFSSFFLSHISFPSNVWQRWAERDNRTIEVDKIDRHKIAENDFSFFSNFTRKLKDSFHNDNKSTRNYRKVSKNDVLWR